MLSKKEIFLKYGYLPEEDGTFIECYNYYMQHPQKNPDVLRRACVEISIFVNFCKRVVVRYKSLKDGKYHQFFDEETEVNFSDYEINLDFGEFIIHKDTDLGVIPFDNLKGLIDMMLLEESYPNVMKRLLRGETFLDEKLFHETFLKGNEWGNSFA